MWEKQSNVKHKDSSKRKFHIILTHPGGVVVCAFEHSKVFGLAAFQISTWMVEVNKILGRPNQAIIKAWSRMSMQSRADAKASEW